MKTLFLIRHAKSSWDNPSLSDFDRPLNSRGLRDAPMMAEVMRKNGFVPELIISSPANRAKTTAKFMADGLNLLPETLLLNSKIYEAASRDLMQLINDLDDAFSTVFLVGHNPGFTYFAENLGGNSIGNIPTCGIVGLSFELASWKYVSAGLGNQFYFDYPKKHY